MSFTEGENKDEYILGFWSCTRCIYNTSVAFYTGITSVYSKFVYLLKAHVDNVIKQRKSKHILVK